MASANIFTCSEFVSVLRVGVINVMEVAFSFIFAVGIEHDVRLLLLDMESSYQEDIVESDTVHSDNFACTYHVCVA